MTISVVQHLGSGMMGRGILVTTPVTRKAQITRAALLAKETGWKCVAVNVIEDK